MSFKKTFAFLLLSVLVAFGAAAEEKDGNGKNHPYGMDIAMGIVGVDDFSSKYENIDWTMSNACVELFPIKVNTYCCPWLNNHLGIYGSVGLLWCGIECGYKNKIGGVEYETTGIGYNFGLELMAGPAFGVDLGDSSVRFQIGAPLRFQFGLGAMVMDADSSNRSSSLTVTRDFSYTAFGLGLTPQFRFAANSRCSFVLGMDFVFDFLYSRKFDNGSRGSIKVEKDPFHFGWRPYLGVGINFGD